MSDQHPEGAAAPRADPDDDHDEETDVDTSHLDGIEDGCGCAEVWDHLSEQRGE